MLKRMVNRADIDFTITLIDPMLIKSGQATVGGVDMSFVRTYRNAEQAEPFIPGSSLKGCIRSYAEKICRSLRENPVPVCLPYLKPGDETAAERNQASCGLRFETHPQSNSLATTDIYRHSCPACRLFGSHSFIGRFGSSDAYITEHCRHNNRPIFETRDGVAIDRITGGPAGGAKYDLEVLSRAEFSTSIEIRNFERWQLGLIGLVLRDMEDGLIRIGMGKSRGLGKITVKIDRFAVSYYGRPVPGLVGMFSTSSDQERRDYGFFPEMEVGTPLTNYVANGLRHVYDLSTEWKTALEPAVADLVNYVKGVQWPSDIQQFVAGGN